MLEPLEHDAPGQTVRVQVARLPSHRDGSVAELLRALAVSKQALNVLLGQLVTMGLVESRRAADDARVKMLRPSGQGARLAARLTRAQSDLPGAVFQTVGLDAEDGRREVTGLSAQSFAQKRAWASFPFGVSSPG